MKAVISKKTYISHFIGLVFVVIAITDVWRYKPTMVLVSAILSVAVFILCFPMKDRNFFSESLLFIVFLIIMSLINLFFTDNGIGGSISLLGTLLLSYAYLQAGNKILTLWIVLSYIITIGYIAYHLFVINTNPNFIYEGLSRNHAGFAVVLWTIFLLFHLKTTHNRFPLVIPFIGLILAFFLFGRTSLIVSMLLLLVVFFFKFKNNNLILLIAIATLMVICYYLYLNFGTKLIEETNLGQGLDTPRWELWRVYWENIDFVTLFTGVDVTNIPIYNEYGGNPHNAFIKFHSRVGIGSIVFIFLVFVSIVKHLQNKQFYILWLLILLTIRAFFDSDILIGNFDFIFFIITFYWLKQN